MIKLITGLPGAGKSLRAVMLVRRYLDEGREVYVDGIDGLTPFGWNPVDARRWQDLPDGAVVIVDESQKVWPTRRAGDVPEEIRALSEHRHRGFDFLLLTQHPTLLDAYVRKLVGEHEHVLRQFGMAASRIITWTECQDDPQSLATRQRGTEKLWKYPAECYPLYKSATMHTVKRRIPFRVAIIPALVLAVPALAWWGWNALTGINQPMASASAMVQGPQGAPVPNGGERGVRQQFATAEDYLRHHMPRVGAMPWSAPWHDRAEPQAQPEIYCIANEAKCQCYTEQITRLEVPLLECVKVAKFGVYNPFRPPLRDRAMTPGAQLPSPSPAAPVAVRAYQSLPAPASTPEVLTRQPTNMGSAWPR